MRFDKQLPLPKGLSVGEGVAMLRELDSAGRCGLRDAPEEALAKAVDFLLEPFVPGFDLPNILRRLVRSQAANAA